MKTYRLQRRLAASLLGVGKGRVWLDPSRLKEIGEAITKADIDALIKEGAIKQLPLLGIKRRAGRARELRKRKRRARGPGRKRKALKRRKASYVARIRKLRAYLASLKQQGRISSQQHRKLRLLAKAGFVRTRSDIEARLK